MGEEKLKAHNHRAMVRAVGRLEKVGVFHSGVYTHQTTLGLDQPGIWRINEAFWLPSGSISLACIAWRSWVYTTQSNVRYEMKHKI
jgi:hypothetical protein